jgi:hypothetical protein
VGLRAVVAVVVAGDGEEDGLLLGRGERRPLRGSPEMSDRRRQRWGSPSSSP